jgi:hypothetical protein
MTLHLTDVLLWSVTEFSSRTHGLLLWLSQVGYYICVASVGALLGMSQQVDDELAALLGQAVRDGLHAARIPIKEAIAHMGIAESQFNAQLQGKPGAHLSLLRLARLPWPFWMTFGPSLMWLLAKRNIDQITESVRKLA